jgi:hypothetical protein
MLFCSDLKILTIGCWLLFYVFQSLKLKKKVSFFKKNNNDTKWPSFCFLHISLKRRHFWGSYLESSSFQGRVILENKILILSLSTILCCQIVYLFNTKGFVRCKMKKLVQSRSTGKHMSCDLTFKETSKWCKMD